MVRIALIDILRRVRQAILLVLLTLSPVLPLAAQQNPEEETTDFMVDGIRVILSPAPNELVSVIIGLEGGLADGATDNPVLGVFTSDLITSSGSKKYPKDAFRRFTSQTSTRIYGDADVRGISFNMTATRHHFDKAWDVLTSLILDPEYDELEYRNIKQRRVADAQSQWARPDGYARRISDSLLLEDNDVLGRMTYPEDVEEVTLDMMREFQGEIRERSRMLVVFVGNVTETEVREKLNVFSNLPLGEYEKGRIPDIDVADPAVCIVDKPSPTTYIYTAFAGPKIDDPLYWPMYVGMSHLRNVLFEEIRTKRNLSYAPGAWTSSVAGRSIGRMSVSTIYPDSSIKIMYDELEKMKKGDIVGEDLNNSRQVFITRYYMQKMTNDQTAESLFYAQRYADSWKHAFSYKDISAVDKASVTRAFQKFAEDLRVGVVGSESGITRDLFVRP